MTNWIQTETIDKHVVLVNADEIAAVIEERDENINSDKTFCTVILKSGSAVQANMQISEFFEAVKELT